MRTELETVALINAELVTCRGRGGRDEQNPVGVIDDGALFARQGKVVWVGPTKELRRKSWGKASKVVDAEGSLVTPGLVDPHTHVLFAGTREDELDRKARGETYAQILESGGGITRTMRETKAASSSRIISESMARLNQLKAAGVTTVELKTGYGDDTREELRALELISRLGKMSGIDVVPTFLGLHAVPSGAKRPDYVRRVIGETLPAVAAGKFRPEFADCFCEEGVFSAKECGSFLKAARVLGIKRKIHADEFSDSGGAAIAAANGCTSADHLGYARRGSGRLMANAGVVVVVLPMTSLNSKAKFADVKSLHADRCRVALGTDLSPNTWVESPQSVMGLACSALNMTADESLRGFTTEAAAAIAKTDVGRLEAGCKADFVVHSYNDYRSIPYRIGGRYVKEVYKAGRMTWRSEQN